MSVFVQTAQMHSVESRDSQVLHDPRKKMYAQSGGFFAGVCDRCPMNGALARWLLNTRERPQQALEGIKTDSSINKLFGLRALVA